MAERDYVWTDQGLASARNAGLSVAEVVEALYAPAGLRYERRVGDLLLIVMGMAETGRVIAVLCDQLEGIATCQIVGARALAGPDLDEWRRHIQ